MTTTDSNRVYPIDKARELWYSLTIGDPVNMNDVRDVLGALLDCNAERLDLWVKLDNETERADNLAERADETKCAVDDALDQLVSFRDYVMALRGDIDDPERGDTLGDAQNAITDYVNGHDGVIAKLRELAP